MILSTRELEARLWATAERLRANSELTSAEYKSCTGSGVSEVRRAWR
jgi:hypothetical protein